MKKREEFYECVFATREDVYAFNLRAWDEEEAESVLRERLRGSGVRTRGKLLIRNLKGDVVRRGVYTAAALEEVSP